MRITTTSRKTLILINSAFALSLLTVGCSSQQQQDEELEVSNDQANQQNLGQDDAAEGNGQENFVDNEEAQDGANGADVNNDTSTDTEDPGTETVNATLDNTGANPAANAAGNPAAQPAPLQNNAMAGAEPTPAVPAAAPAPAAPAEGAPVQGGRVRYVKSGGVQVVSSPGGAPVMTLNQGEHPVTWEENGYLRLTTGMYVPVDAMSDQGVPRGGSGAVWNQ